MQCMRSDHAVPRLASDLRQVALHKGTAACLQHIPLLQSFVVSIYVLLSCSSGNVWQ